MKSFILFIILLICISIPSKAQKDRIIFKNITTVDGLSSNRIFDIFEDSKGLIWLSTGDGLNLFDGSKITFIYKERTVRKVLEDPITTNLILSTRDGLVIYDRKKDRFEDLIFHNNKTDLTGIYFVSDIVLNNQNELFLGSVKKLHIINPSKTDYETFEIKIDGNNIGVESILCYEDGRIIVGTAKGIFSFDRKNKKFTHLHKELITGSVTKLRLDSQNNLWVCTYKDGLFMFEASDLSKKPKYYSMGNGYLLSNRARDMLEIEPNKYFILNRNGGLVYLDITTNETKNYVPDLHDPYSLATKALTRLFKDSHNNIWVGTFRNGLDIIDHHRKKFELYRINFKDNGLMNNNVSSFLQDSLGDIWVGTDNGGGLSKFDPKTGAFINYKADFDNPHGLHDEYVLCLEELDEDRLLLGTLKSGVEVFNKKTKQFSHFPIRKTDKGGENAFFIKKDLKGNIWVAGGMEFYKFDITTGNFQVIKDIIRVETIIQADENTLWLATYFSNGLLEFNVDTHEYKTFTPDTTNAKNKWSALLSIVKKDSKGNLWIGTDGDGLFYIKANSNNTIQYTTDHGLPHNQVTNILFESDTILWISTVNGLSKFNTNSKTFRNYDINDGLQGNEFGVNASMKAKNGQMYFGGRKGFNVFMPNEIVDNLDKPNVHLIDFKLFNKSVPVDTLDSPLTKHISETQELTLNHKQSIMTFGFVAINFSSPEKNQYAHKLEGFEEEWNYIGNKREATYTNLPPGDYTLRVKAANNDGVWNEEGVSLKLTILPPWWETWWFRSITLFIIVGGSILFYIVRMQQMKEQQSKLEAKVAERTRDLQEANIILEESKEEISQQNEELEVKQNELIARNDELAAQKKEILDKNLEIEVKNTVLEEQKEHLKEKNEIVEQINANIKASINYAKTIQNAILPTKADMDKSFNNFVIFKPKDIVSGDFYWMSRIDDTTNLVAAVDCTGHGVPGAFMSMIGSRLLNNIVNEQKITSPKEILSKMHAGVKKALKQETSENDDGMDICLCKIEQNNGIKITYSGAKRPLYYYDTQSNEVLRIKGSLNAIGGNFHLADYPYTNTEINLNKGDQIILSSDGYIDQNNVERKSFGVHKFKSLLQEIAALSTEEQKTKINETLNDYMKGTKQRDDIVVIGIKF